MQPDFWDDNRQAQKILRRISELRETADTHHRLLTEAGDLKNLLALAEREGEAELFQEAVLELTSLRQEFEEFELHILFAGEYDRSNAIVPTRAQAGLMQDCEMLAHTVCIENMNYELWDLILE